MLILENKPSSILYDSFLYTHIENEFTIVKINNTIIQINDTTSKLDFDYVFQWFLKVICWWFTHAITWWPVKPPDFKNDSLKCSHVKCLSVNYILKCFHFSLSVSAVCKWDVCYFLYGQKQHLVSLVSPVVPWILSHLTFSSLLLLADITERMLWLKSCRWSLGFVPSLSVILQKHYFPFFSCFYHKL